MVEPMIGLKRSHGCAALRDGDVGGKATLMGWVHRRREFGGMTFIDLRDRDGITQVVFNPQHNSEAFEKSQALKSEFVIAVTGTVGKRPDGTTNARLATGDVELLAESIRILNTSKTSPVPVADETQATDEALRMKYRFLDLRRDKMKNRIIMRHQIAKAMRDYLDSQGFLEIETPILVRSTPEGARDYLVPSRVNPGKFYALPQSPQLFKQLLMVGGLERYFQIARCFRDEDLRADRQPEFTQLDLEMSFVEQDDVFTVIEGTLKHVFKQVAGIDLQTPFIRVPYREIMERYGSDKPDTRFGMEIFDVTEGLRGTEFARFNEVLERNGTIRGIAVPEQAGASRKELDTLAETVKSLGAAGLYAVAFQADGVKSSIGKFLQESHVNALRAHAKEGDLVLLVAHEEKSKALDILGRLRLELGRQHKLIPPGTYNFLWVVNFPQFHWNEEEQRLEAEHHPFTSPLPEDIPLIDTDPRNVRSSAYDLVLNGNELGSGSIRIHQRPLQERIFQAIGLNQEEANEKFGFLMEAFEYGAPPHGGIALGFDRLTAIMSGVDSIREVVAFPKNQNAVDPMTGAPVEVAQDQLDIVRIQVKATPKAPQESGVLV
ncbi:MAG: aspartate--tRNA ligase [Armatimonadetes bacterium]|nr:aspartate--tRNA ligase [Armatimonadota bacterium]